LPLATGQILKERYRIVKLLGQGGFGAVYRAWDIVLERPCAVKENLDPRPAAERQFQREAKILARLDHPNLPDVKDYFVIPGQGQYLVMDFVEGDDLEELLARSGGKLAEEQAVGYAVQVCRALEYLHSQNPPVIHRDIKPANIKVAPNGQIKLVDFGIAKALDSTMGTLSGAQAATPGYAPFEQYGQEPTDARSDVYSLGATLYTLLTGQPPLESIARVKGRTLVNPSQLNPRLSAYREAAILKALELHPDQRFQSAAEFRMALEPSPLPLSLEWRGGARVPTVLVSPPEEVKSQPYTEPIPAQQTLAEPRPAWLWPAGVGVVVVACLLGGIWLLSNVVPPPRTPAPPTLVETNFEPTQAEAESTVMFTSPPAAANTEAGFTPTSQVISTTEISSQLIDDKGVSMAFIPAGEFQMGSQSGSSDEQPVHAVYLDAYYIDVFEVTNALYTNCVQASGCSPPHDTTRYRDTEYAQHPVVYVDWSQAQTYCRWRGGDLPTEAQWEKAARGGLEGKLYPWGDEAPVCTPGAENGAQFTSCDGQTVEVGNFSLNGYGLFDMAGNVWEWVLDWYLDSFYSSSPFENPSGPNSGQYRVLRGGSWVLNGSSLRVAVRNWLNPVSWFDYGGFRCSRLP